MATASSSPADRGIMSWKVDPAATKYGIKVRPASQAGSDPGKFHTVPLTADDTSDGTMDVAISRYGYTPGVYQFLWMSHTKDGWGRDDRCEG